MEKGEKLSGDQGNAYYRRCMVENGIKPEDLLK